MKSINICEFIICLYKYRTGVDGGGDATRSKAGKLKAGPDWTTVTDLAGVLDSTWIGMMRSRDTATGGGDRGITTSDLWTGDAAGISSPMSFIFLLAILSAGSDWVEWTVTTRSAVATGAATGTKGATGATGEEATGAGPMWMGARRGA